MSVTLFLFFTKVPINHAVSPGAQDTVQWWACASWVDVYTVIQEGVTFKREGMLSTTTTYL